MIFGIGASEWLDAIAWLQQVAAPAVFWIAVGTLVGRFFMNGFLMLAGVAIVIIGLCIFAIGWGMISP